MENPTLSHHVLEFLVGLDTTTAYLAISGMLLACGLGLPMPEDITILSAGILSSQDVISFPGALIVCYFGVLAGDVLLFFIGRKYGRRVFTFPILRTTLTPERIQAAEERIQKNAKLICFTARFLPGLRAAIYLTSGVLRVSPATFLVQDGLAALLSVPALVYIGHWFGKNIDAALEVAHRFNVALLVSALALVAFFFIRHKLRQRRLTAIEDKP